MRRGFGVAVVLAAFCLPQVSYAETLRFNCAFKQITNKNYIAQKAEVTLDLPRWAATIDDPVAKKAMGKSVRGKVETQNDKRITLSWLVENLPKDVPARPGYGSSYRLEYRLTIYANGSAKIAASNRDVFYQQRNYSATGSCSRIG